MSWTPRGRLCVSTPPRCMEACDVQVRSQVSIQRTNAFGLGNARKEEIQRVEKQVRGGQRRTWDRASGHSGKFYVDFREDLE